MRTISGASLAAWMAAALLAIATLAYWDAQRESSASLADFADEQTIIARAITASLSTTLSVPGGTTAAFSHLHALERAGALIVLYQREGAHDWTSTSGHVVAVPALDEAQARTERSVRLSREQSLALGLPERMSIAGFAALDTGPSGPLVVAVISSAQRERDRELRAKVRLVLGVGLAAGLVLAFGGVALRKQKTELELAGALAVAEVQRQRDERLVRADKLATMGALATGIAHEVSTPLGVIVGRAEQLLPKVANDDRAKRAVEAILEQGERISRVIRGFLLLARGDSPTFEHADPASIARKSMDLVEHRFAKAQVALHADIADGPSWVACEPRLLEQALANLLLNACDACDSGGHVELLVRDSGDKIAFVVRDDGVGIPPESAAALMEPFFTTKPSGRGTGLGLAIAKEIVNHHHGVLSLSPRDGVGGRGTQACIEIPAVRRES